MYDKHLITGELSEKVEEEGASIIRRKIKTGRKKTFGSTTKTTKVKKRHVSSYLLVTKVFKFQASIKAYQNSQSQILSRKDKGKDYSLGPQEILKIVFI